MENRIKELEQETENLKNELKNLEAENENFKEQTKVLTDKLVKTEAERVDILNKFMNSKPNNNEKEKLTIKDILGRK